MEWHKLLVEGYGRVQQSMGHVLTGLSQDVLDWQPKDGNNTIGWLAWHLTRQQDAQIASLMSKDQLWIRGKWYKKFKRSADPKDSGFGHTKEQVKTFKSPDINTLIEYQKAVFERSRDYFLTLPKLDLEKKLNEPWFQPLPTVGVRLISILEDSLLHAGQMAYIRGLRQGKGWQKY